MAELVARWASPDVLVVAGGREKHMSRGMNKVLETYFADVSASRGQSKCRALLASAPHPPARDAETSAFPRSERHHDLEITVCAHGATFAGTGIDLGTRFLAGFLDQTKQDVSEIIDLGCGSGVLATLAARRFPDGRVLAVDESAAACRSAQATAAANDVADRVTVRRGDGLVGLDDDSVDLVVCNPPFHRGTTRDSSVAFEMFADAERVLRPGGELWTVFNTHLPYRPELRRCVGPTKIIGQNPAYVVTRSIRLAPGLPTGRRKGTCRGVADALPDREDGGHRDISPELPPTTVVGGPATRHTRR